MGRIELPLSGIRNQRPTTSPHPEKTRMLPATPPTTKVEGIVSNDQHGPRQSDRNRTCDLPDPNRATYLLAHTLMTNDDRPVSGRVSEGSWSPHVCGHRSFTSLTLLSSQVSRPSLGLALAVPQGIDVVTLVLPVLPCQVLIRRSLLLDLRAPDGEGSPRNMPGA